MTITTTELDIITLESMEFAPSCEYQFKEDSGFCSDAAEWVYIALRPLECGCMMPDRFFCTPCKEKRSNVFMAWCIICKQTIFINMEPREYRFEPIGNP